MKNLIKLIALCLIPLSAWGQNIVIRNDGASTTLTGTNLDPGALAVSSKGELFCTAGTAAASLGKAEDAAHTSGDVGVMSLGVRNDSRTAYAGADGDYSPISVNDGGAVRIVLDRTWQNNDTTNILKLEDNAHTSGDAGVMSLGVANINLSNNNANGDYGAFAMGLAGNSYVTPIFDIDISQTRQATTREDTAVVSSSVLIMAGAQAQDPIVIEQDTNGDATQLKTTRGGKLQVAFAPATEYWKGCGTATGVTSDVAIKAAVASNKIYVSSISCKNTSTTQNSNLDFKDGSTTFAEGSIGAFVTGTSQPGTFTQQFPVPAQITSATAFNFATTTATSSVTCCANGFISVD